MTDISRLTEMQTSASLAYGAISKKYTNDNEALVVAFLVARTACQSYGFENDAEMVEAFKMTLQTARLKDLVSGAIS